MTARPIPPHGTPARYLGTPRTGNRPPCKCRKCINAHTKACALREAQRLAGRPLRIPTPPITAHVQQLLDADMSRNSIAIAAGVSAAVVSHIARSYNPTTNRYIAEKILAVTTPRVTRDTELMNPIGAQRRLQALYTRSHGPVALVAATSLSDSVITNIVSPRPGQVTVGTHRAICAAYTLLASQEGSSHKARYRAEREGWPGPDFWDDVPRIDDPTFDPRTVLANTPMYMRLGEDALWLREQGYTIEQIAHRLDKKIGYVEKSISRYLAATDTGQVAA